MENRPDYKKIYLEIISKKYPDKEPECKNILSKEHISFMDVIKLNDIIFCVSMKDNLINNQRHKSYDRETISKILEYQNKNALNNTQVALKFKLSRNTITKWRKIYKDIFDSKLYNITQ